MMFTFATLLDTIQMPLVTAFISLTNGYGPPLYRRLREENATQPSRGLAYYIHIRNIFDCFLTMFSSITDRVLNRHLLNTDQKIHWCRYRELNSGCSIIFNKNSECPYIKQQHLSTHQYTSLNMPTSRSQVPFMNYFPNLYKKKIPFLHDSYLCHFYMFVNQLLIITNLKLIVSHPLSQRPQEKLKSPQRGDIAPQWELII